MELVPEEKEEAKPQRHNEEEQQGSAPDAPDGAERTAGPGAPRCIQQKKREASGQRQRSREAVCPGAVTVPGTVQGFLREILPVTCTHQPGRETLPKFWCKASTRTGVTCATYIASTAKLQPEVRQGGFSSLNSCMLRAFRVTAERLAKEDAGSRRCGMQKGFFPLQESADLEVLITPGRSLHVFLPRQK